MDEFKRLDILLRAADDAAIQVRGKNTEVIQDYFIVMYQIYMMLKPYMSYSMKKLFRYYNKLIGDELDELFEDEQNGVREFPRQLVRRLTYYHEMLLVAKHKLGLSLPVQKQINFKSKMSHALLGKS